MALQTPSTGRGFHALPANLTPDSIDVPSELAQILSRVRYTDNANKSSAPTPAASAGDNAAAATTNAGTLPIKDLPAAVDPLRHKIQRARAAVHTLPDIGRTLSEQEAEARQLEARIERQRAALLQLKEFGLRFAAEAENKDVEMTGAGVGAGAGDARGLGNSSG